MYILAGRESGRGWLSTGEAGTGKGTCTGEHPAHSSLRKKSPAELMLLPVVWDETASGTARSKTENVHSIPFPMLLLAVLEAVSSHTKTRSRSAVQSIFCITPCCPRGNLVPYKSEENQFHPVLASLGTGTPMQMNR